MTESNFDELIGEAVGADGFDEDQIACIVGYVDIKDKSLLTPSELRDGLLRLIDAGRVRELEHLRFALGCDEARRFSGVSQAEFDAAVATYQRWLSARFEVLRAQR